MLDRLQSNGMDEYIHVHWHSINDVQRDKGNHKILLIKSIGGKGEWIWIKTIKADG